LTKPDALKGHTHTHTHTHTHAVQFYSTAVVQKVLNSGRKYVHNAMPAHKQMFRGFTFGEWMGGWEQGNTVQTQE